MLIHNGETIGVEIPDTVGARSGRNPNRPAGDTASGGSKPATLETGAVVQVPPLFIGVGEIIRVDTRMDSLSGACVKKS